MSETSPELCNIRPIILHSQNGSGSGCATVEAHLDQPVQAHSDEQLIQLWLHGRSRHTELAYRRDAARFQAAVKKPFRQTTLGDVQSFASSLDGENLKISSRLRVLSAVKSLFAFGHAIGYLTFDVARPLRLRGSKDLLAERILDEGEIHEMLGMERHPRNHALLLLLYATGVRVSEICELRWRDLKHRGSLGQVTVFGKGSKTRAILLPSSVWSKISALRGQHHYDDPVFRSRKGGPLTPSQIWRIVRRSAKRAGISKGVSCHWLRHAHASHALDHGAPIHLVQTILGHSSLQTTSRYLHALPTDSSATYLDL